MLHWERHTHTYDRQLFSHRRRRRLYAFLFWFHQFISSLIPFIFIYLFIHWQTFKNNKRMKVKKKSTNKMHKYKNFMWVTDYCMFEFCIVLSCFIIHSPGCCILKVLSCFPISLLVLLLFVICLISSLSHTHAPPPQFSFTTYAYKGM